MTKQKTSEGEAIAVRVEQCLACGACELACAEGHSEAGSLLEAIANEMPLVSRVRVIAAAGKSVPVQCRHCADAPCAAACPTGALYREKAGRVLSMQEKCISCGACARVCPYEAVTLVGKDGEVVKCDVCEGLLEEGEQPFCVDACPTGCLRLSCIEDIHAGSDKFDSLVRDESRLHSAGPAVEFEIIDENCICCGRCARACPVDCISGKPGKDPAKATDADREKGKVGRPFEIDQQECVHCGTCLEVCPADAIAKSSC